jgi:hypothetical protein
MKKLTIAIGVAAISITIDAVAYGGILHTESPTEFFKGHSHSMDGTIGAPSHSGGLDRNGCHNKSVPYHCH